MTEITDEMVARAAAALCDARLWPGAWIRANEVESDNLRHEARAALTAALSPAPQAQAGGDAVGELATLLEAECWQGSFRQLARAAVAGGWHPPSHAREQAERIARLEAALTRIADGREVADPNCPGATIVVSVDNPDEIATAALTPPASQEGQADG